MKTKHLYPVDLFNKINKTDVEVAALLGVSYLSARRWRLGQTLPIPPLRIALAKLADVKVEDVRWEHYGE